MSTGGGQEFEYQFKESEYDRKRILNWLKSNGKLVHKRTKYRIKYLYEENNKSFIRVRDEAGQLTLTRKDISVQPPLEDEIKLGKEETFETAVVFARAVAPPKSIELTTEKYREKWKITKGGIDCHEVVFDEWAGLPPYMEIDCSNQKSLEKTIEELGLEDAKYFTKGAFDYYEELYGIDRKILFRTNLNFADILKNIGEHIKRNEKLLKKLQKKYKEKDY